ncbi:MAG TPA: hypothetical protein VLM91_24820 [Candidatus Methylomirabilis sp.]|nr:hypothetical protein [Candidatus Methylomirabilis sp.]
MFLRASVVWLGILVLAIGNGALRESVISPRAGPQIGHVLSTVLLCVLIAAVAWFTIPWIAPGTMGRALATGGWWLVLTLGFEFLAGHYLFGDSWDKLLADYNIARGRIWLLVPLVTFFAPLVAQRFRTR